jgi:hypothetical protein
MNIHKYNKLNAVIKRHFQKDMGSEMQLRTHDVFTRPALT